MQTKEFQHVLRDYYRKHGRSLPWRVPEADGSFDAYKILVSEMMLQQTQVTRVIPKYYEFLERFPNTESLAESELGAVLKKWSGLGYNRRAKFLWQAAKIIVERYKGQVPRTLEGLVALPGVGRNTAGAILAYAYNQPVVFIETNIRTVYIHHFFPDETAVSDKEILDMLRLTLPSQEEQPDEAVHSLPGARRNPERVFHYREWYWALMDYGSYLKASVGNLSKFGQTYTKQSPFEGSKRQIRGQVVRKLTEGRSNIDQLRRLINDMRLQEVLAELEREGIVRRSGMYYRLS